MPLTQGQIKAYETEGFVPKVQISDETAAAQHRELFNKLEARVGREECQIGLIDQHFDEEFIWEIATHPKILDCIEALIGPNVMMLSTHFFCKYGPDEKKFVAWHQDVTYWGLEPPEAITAWYAIDDSDCENGCMRVIPGTHRPGIREHGKSGQDGNLLSIDQEVPVSKNEEQNAVDLVLKAGEISIHHGTLIHGSMPNQSTRRRCGLTVRYIPPWVKQIERNSLGHNWSTILLRGENREKNFAELPKPFPMK